MISLMPLVGIERCYAVALVLIGIRRYRCSRGSLLGQMPREIVCVLAQTIASTHTHALWNAK